MTEQAIAWLAYVVMLALGLVMIAVGRWIPKRTERRNESCTDQTVGVVVRHVFRGEGRMFPVVQFSVGGKHYEARKRFEYVKRVRFSRLRGVARHPNAYETPDGKLYLRIGTIIRYRKVAEELWPIGSEMTVYFNPENPSINYVDRPIRNYFLSRMFFFAGGVMCAVGVMLFAVS